MKKGIKENFLVLWKKYFDRAELPIVFYYTDAEVGLEIVSPSARNRCLISNLTKVCKGIPLRFAANSIGCFGGRRHLGFSQTLRPNFEYFLSCGIPGKMEGERYKKSPEIVKEIMEKMPKFKAPKKFIVFKRWDLIEESENPEVVIFFAPPDVLSGLFTLANFDQSERNGVIAPFGAGCASIVQYPYLEKDSDRPRCVIGMFDPSARPYLPSNSLTFSAPMNKFFRMIKNMKESFLITSSWGRISKRIIQSKKP